jgi:transposase
VIPVSSGVRVWLAVGHTDMRRGMNSLAIQVQEGLKRDPHAGDLYVFRGKRGQQSTFCIRFSIRDDRLPLASAIRADVPGVAVSARQTVDVHLYG